MPQTQECTICLAAGKSPTFDPNVEVEVVDPHTVRRLQSIGFKKRKCLKTH